ncbi:MAG TPA: hypothetical protein VF855_14235 [Acidimicrobiales bacterium]
MTIVFDEISSAVAEGRGRASEAEYHEALASLRDAYVRAGADPGRVDVAMAQCSETKTWNASAECSQAAEEVLQSNERLEGLFTAVVEATKSIAAEMQQALDGIPDDERPEPDTLVQTLAWYEQLRRAAWEYHVYVTQDLVPYGWDSREPTGPPPDLVWVESEQRWVRAADLPEGWMP